MKRRFKLISASVFGMLLLSLPFLTFAQQSPEGQQMRHKQEMKKDRMTRMEENIPDLTAEQKKSIEVIHLSAMKDVKPMKNELGEKEARFKTLNSADKPDMNAINKQIDEIAAIKTQIAKREAKAHQEVRAVLNEDQRIAFDMHRDQRRMEKSKHKAHH